MDYLTEDDLHLFFQRHRNKYITASGMKIGWTEKDGIWTHLVHQTYEQGPWEVSIATEFDDPTTFATGFNLKSFQDLEKIDYTSSWIRYLNGAAEIIIMPIELEMAVSFRIYKYKTLIFCLEKHFYDEVNTHLTIPEDFEKYFDQNERLLYKISEINF